MQAWHWWQHSDLLTQVAAALLLAMSVASWVVIVVQLRLLLRAGRELPRALAAFWQAPQLAEARQRLPAFDRLGLLQPLLDAANLIATDAIPASLGAQGGREQRLTRVLRGALHQVLARLQWGQVLLATVGATAPFVGLLGTVWGIYHALTALAGQGQISIEQLAAPVGEALVMTAAGLAVAIPAVLAYNWCGRSSARIEAELEGLAHDLRSLLLG